MSHFFLEQKISKVSQSVSHSVMRTTLRFLGYFRLYQSMGPNILFNLCDVG